MTPAPSSPVPKTRVERVDLEPAHGEVPGTEAHRIREEDAKPDEIAIAPDSTSLPSEQDSPPSDSSSASHTPPKTVVSETTGSTGPHSEEFQERLEEAHKADAIPDAVTQVDDVAEGEETDATSPVESSAGYADAADAADNTTGA